MPCGPQMVRRVLVGATHEGSGFIANRPCLGEGPVAPSDEDRRRLRAALVWLAWASFALVSAIAIVSAL